MLRLFPGLIALALIGAVSALPGPASAAGFRGFSGGVRAQFIPRVRMGFPLAAPRLPVSRGFHTHFGPKAPARAVIPPAAQGFARTPLHSFAGLTRRHHSIYRAGWVFPATYGDDGYGYIGTPYDPAEAIPVYGPAPATDAVDPPSRAGVAQPRISNVNDNNLDACRAENVTVPGAEGDREIRVVRC